MEMDGLVKQSSDVQVKTIAHPSPCTVCVNRRLALDRFQTTGLLLAGYVSFSDCS